MLVFFMDPPHIYKTCQTCSIQVGLIGFEKKMGFSIWVVNGSDQLGYWLTYIFKHAIKKKKKKKG